HVEIARHHRARYPNALWGTTNEILFGDALVCGGAGDCCIGLVSNGASVRPKVFSRDAVALHWAFPRREDCGDYRRAGPAQSVLHGRGKRRPVEDERCGEYLDADF